MFFVMWIHSRATLRFPLLGCVHTLIKIAQAQDVFVCDFVDVVNLAQHELYRLYCDPKQSLKI
jgi:hypothetical protein